MGGQKTRQKKGMIATFFRRYINGSKGVISLFLAILMVPFLSVAGILLNTARINSMVAIFDEALCNASNSTLGTYDEFLRSRFGLLAMSQNTSTKGVNYTAQHLINDTFQEYMRRNVGALSNTYFDVETEGYGVYPLADPHVLYSQICEAGKYSVPTKLAIDFTSIDSIISSFTSNLDVWSDIADVSNHAFGAADAFLEVEEKQDILREAVKTGTTKKTDKDTGYGAFSGAVTKYNSLVDERVTKLQECENTIQTAKENIESGEKAVEEESAKQKELVEQLLTLENEKDSRGNKVDNSAAIALLKETNEEALEPYLTAREKLEEAEEVLSDAETDREKTEAEYKRKLADARTDITDKRNAYAAALEAYAEAIKTVGEDAVETQSAFQSAVSESVAFAADIAQTASDTGKKASEKKVKDLNEQLKTATESGDTEKANDLRTQIKQEEQDCADGKYAADITKTATEVTGTLPQNIIDFNKRDFNREYDGYYQEVIRVKGIVESYEPAKEDTRKSDSTEQCKTSVEMRLTEADVDELSSKLGEEAAKSSFFGLLKTVFDFIIAMLTLDIWFDWELTGYVSDDYLNGQGGLPSERDRTDDRYSLDSKYAASDKEQSDRYKEALNSYLSDNGKSLGATDIQTIIDNIKSNCNLIRDGASEIVGLRFFHGVYSIISGLVGLVTGIFNFVKWMIENVAKAVGERALMAGYIGYNTPNRTTYTGKALTGASYSSSLPTMQDPLGSGFLGAETEYIIMGMSYEAANQTAVFMVVYLIRALSDIVPVVTNDEVKAFGTAAEAALSFVGLGPLGKPLVYITFVLIEAMVDTIIMVNGGDIPILKKTVYFTPSGVPDLVDKIVKIPLTEDAKKKMEKGLNDTIRETVPGGENVSLKDNPTTQTKPTAGEKIRDAFSIDYTQTLILIIMVFGSEDMLKRLGDVIQMEATCAASSDNKIGSYSFNLDHSYTYLRASGQFDGHEFIKLSDTGILTSTKRVVYRGY